MNIEQQKERKTKKNNHQKISKIIRDGLLVSMISLLPFSKDVDAQNNNIVKNMTEGRQIERNELGKDDSLRFERQKEHFDAADKRDLKRDIIVLYHDTITDTYRKKKVFIYGKNRHHREKISRERFENPETLKTPYSGGYPSEHILIVDQKYKHINYKKAKKILDEQRIQARIKKNQAKQNNISE